MKGRVVVGRRGVLALLGVSCGAMACRRETYSVTGRGLPSGWRERRLEASLGARRALVLSSREDQREAVLWSRDLGWDLPLRGGALVHTALLLAVLRGELVTADTVFRCDGSRCERAHGAIRPADALALGCRTFFVPLASRVGTSMLASAFAVLGLASPSVPDDPVVRTRFALEGEGWVLRIQDTLAMGQALSRHPEPAPTMWSEALVPRSAEPGPLRGVVAVRDTEAWFVGYSVGSEPRWVSAFVSDCDGRPGQVVVSLARATHEAWLREGQAQRPVNPLIVPRRRGRR
ncbi:MAG: hypothetical protein Q8Q09_02440 [Deltaproteobacteria bacterium]|nr:hypothetical protein [Deltaproteobacteria bacterium]